MKFRHWKVRKLRLSVLMSGKWEFWKEARVWKIPFCQDLLQGITTNSPHLYCTVNPALKQKIKFNKKIPTNFSAIRKETGTNISQLQSPLSHPSIRQRNIIRFRIQRRNLLKTQPNDKHLHVSFHNYYLSIF